MIRLASTVLFVTTSLVAQSSRVIDMGGGFAGTNGIPQLTAYSESSYSQLLFASNRIMSAGPAAYEMANAAAESSAMYVVGFSEANSLLGSGVLIPSSDLTILGVTDAQGAIKLSLSEFPLLSSSLYLQCIVADAGAVGGLALSNGLRFEQDTPNGTLGGSFSIPKGTAATAAVSVLNLAEYWLTVVTGQIQFDLNGAIGSGQMTAVDAASVQALVDACNARLNAGLLTIGNDLGSLSATAPDLDFLPGTAMIGGHITGSVGWHGTTTCVSSEALA